MRRNPPAGDSPIADEPPAPSRRGVRPAPRPVVTPRLVLTHVNRGMATMKGKPLESPPTEHAHPGEPMADERWSRLRELFDRVRDRSAEERGALLDADEALDPGLRRELEALLQAHDAAEGFLADPPTPAAGSL